MRKRSIFATAARVARRFAVAIALGLLAVGAFGAAAAQQPKTFTPSDEAPEDFPTGAGRDETFYACVACHNFKLVAAQGMNRRQWEESVELMVSKHGMNPLPHEDLKIVLDYLERTYPPSVSPRGRESPNPFLK